MNDEIKRTSLSRPAAATMTPQRHRALAAAVSMAFAHNLQAQVTVKQVEAGSLVKTNPTTTSTLLTHSTAQNIVSFYKFRWLE